MNKIAVVVGHDKIEQGAYSNLLKHSEFGYHSEVVKHLPFDIYYRDSSVKGYKGKMQKLATEINKKNYSLVCELHYNSFNGVANGCEALYFKGSVVGKRQAEIFVDAVTKEYKTTKRGAKEISKESDRGYWFLKLINAPALILEPFFGDNKEAIEFKDVKRYADLLVKTLC